MRFQAERGRRRRQSERGRRRQSELRRRGQAESTPWRWRHGAAYCQMDRHAAECHHESQGNGRRIASQRAQVELCADEDEECRDEETLGYAGELHLKAGRLAQTGQDQTRPKTGKKG
jgi:hypothetical protein